MTKQLKTIVAQVIPLKRFPVKLACFDYVCPADIAKKIKVGALVEIPFRKGLFLGLVMNFFTTDEADSEQLKAISRIVADRPLYSDKQMAFLREISEFYLTSLGYLAKTSLPAFNKKQLKELAEVRPLKSAKTVGKKTNIFVKPNYFFYSTTNQIKDYLRENFNPRAQSLVLTPEINSANPDLLPCKLADQTVLISSALTKRSFFDSWLEVWIGRKNIVAGTRRSLFMPFTNLSDIYVLDEANPNYKSWDMAPRINIIQAVIFLALCHGARLHFLSHTPSVESYYFSDRQVYDSTGDLDADFATPTKLVDMRAERREHNYGFISGALVEAIKNCPNRDIFFFLNKRGTAGYVGCRDCGTVLKCLTCDNLYTYHEDINCLVCHFCQQKISLPKHCQHCSGLNMVMLGVGSQLAEKEIKKLLGQKENRQIIRIDSDNAGIFKIDPAVNHIFIGTQLAWNKVDWAQIGLVAFLDADTSLFVPQYNISETLFYWLRDAQYKLGAKGQLLIQTSHPDHLVFKSLNQPTKFYQSELTARKALGYPPFYFLLKLFYSDTDQTVGKIQADNVITLLKRLTLGKNDVIILGPMPSVPYFKAGKYTQVILCKIKYNNYKSITKTILRQLPAGWKADPAPNSILTI
ncbi:MAG: hypothetical protein COU31_00670 [Candidatus Magasanikbacteria bacterium CG10_big_fil_rev_8_21_14_0_10_40_10]|uniref:Primosomal protein N' 3' DNA-binding domain-containing protein n=1 Tax=Candidatus Magasanikbacteria bacterium CG10_big_fil_rev_8_21_14_0_10_40_10 TaxID=1974648 RepID=A0A2M6W4W1_9BACT|nr:MAG: hypothetical protein COU31_00670 [Candidatus Magasanikbacteria bacterium CG10_big_fil_rev_8_21_14_0_10_40_10]